MAPGPLCRLSQGCGSLGLRFTCNTRCTDDRRCTHAIKKGAVDTDSIKALVTLYARVCQIDLVDLSCPLARPFVRYVREETACLVNSAPLKGGPVSPCDSTRSVSRLFPHPTPDLYVINGTRVEIELEISNYALLRNFLENGHCSDFQGFYKGLIGKLDRFLTICHFCKGGW